MYRGQNVLKQRLRRYYRPKYLPRTQAVWIDQDAKPMLGNLRRRRQQLWPNRQDAVSLSAMTRGRFCFLNQTIDLAADSKAGFYGLNWQPNAPRLWRFHLHYHESLLELAGQAGANVAWQMVESWLADDENQSPYSDPDAWHPFCISMRLPNWLMLAGTEEVPDSFQQPFWDSVSRQLDWLWRNPEWDLGGNHLLENLRTLAVADAVLGGDVRIDRRRLYRWINREIVKQVLPTGEHFERTPTYHALMLLALIEIGNAAEFVGESCLAENAVESMASFLQRILQPDGNVPLFGDSVIAETPDPQVLILESGSGLMETDLPRNHRREDYWLWRSTDGTSISQHCLIFDVGNAACDHLPAHAHADLLCISASVFNERLLVDTGTFDYEDTPQRRHCRSTFAHNTASVDQRNQFDLWSRFRMGRRGHVRGKAMGSGDGFEWCLAWHDGYADTGVTKVFRLVISKEANGSHFYWLIADWIDSADIHHVSSPLHIGPAFQVATIDTTQSVCRSVRQLGGQIFVRSSATTTLGRSDYYPDFGHRISVDRIEQSATLASQQPLVWTLSSEQHNEIPEVRPTSDLCEISWAPGVSFHVNFHN